MDDVVAADDEHGDVGTYVVRQRVELMGELPRLGADLGRADEPHRPVGFVGQTLRKLHAERPAAAVSTEARGDRVAEHEQGQRVSALALVDPVDLVAVLAERLPDGRAGHPGLGPQQVPGAGEETGGGQTEDRRPEGGPPHRGGHAARGCRVAAGRPTSGR